MHKFWPIKPNSIMLQRLQLIHTSGYDTPVLCVDLIVNAIYKFHKFFNSNDSYQKIFLLVHKSITGTCLSLIQRFGFNFRIFHANDQRSFIFYEKKSLWPNHSFQWNYFYLGHIWPIFDWINQIRNNMPSTVLQTNRFVKKNFKFQKWFELNWQNI